MLRVPLRTRVGAAPVSSRNVMRSEVGERLNPEQRYRDRVQAVLRAQATIDAEDDLVAHVQAVEAGPEILPAIRDTVLRCDWSRPGPTGKLAALTALMLVAHDVDEGAVSQLSEELTEQKRLHPVFIQRLASINRFTLDDYTDLTISGVRVLLAKSLEAKEEPLPYLNRWLAEVPDQDRAEISRLYVTERTQDRYWGEYLHILSTVSLVWRSGASRSLLPRLATQLTLYHEIGHHNQRTEKLTAAEAESRADAYALARFAAAHPVFGRGLLGRLTASLAMGRVV